MNNNIDEEKLLKSYFKKDSNNCLREFPVKYQKQLIVCKYIMRFLDADRFYTEKEINELLKDIYSDYASLRRYLVEFSLIDRHKDGSLYWVKKQSKEKTL
jgi:hypothetical protein